MPELNRLEERIYRRRTKIRLEGRRVERRQGREEEAAKRKIEEKRHLVTNSHVVRLRNKWQDHQDANVRLSCYWQRI